ncbi:MAG: hypothetical protein LBU42_06230 [Prevotellaceae bacterium]|jgi:hypothetical protein|nr:hypothetical protein [Prevotellaceae bacterium]
MKTILFFFALLAGITASANVYITPLSTDYTNKTVTFRVEWTGDVANDRVWVFVDLCPVDGTTSGTFTKAVISGATHTAGGIDATTLPGRGFYVTANLTTVSVTLSNAVGQFNWCAYGSGFPPNAKDDGSGGSDLKGTPPFVITTAAGTVEVTDYTYSGGEITALTDATGCPGALCGKNGESAGILNCCAPGTTNCSGTCKTAGTYTTNDGTCAGSCNAAYVQLRNQCGTVINATYGTYANTGCTTPNYTTNDGDCTATCKQGYIQLRNSCGAVINPTYAVITRNDCVNTCPCGGASSMNSGTTEWSNGECINWCRSNGTYRYEYRDNVCYCCY